MRLNLKTIATLVLPEGKSEMIVFDEDLSGFGLRIRAGGKRTWVYQFKIGDQNRRVTLGSVAALTPLRARETAGELHAMVRLGRDPAGEKTEGRARAAETVAVTVQTYLDHKRKSLRLRSYDSVERHLMKYCKSLHSLPLAKVDRRAVAARISAVAAECGEVSANRTRASLSAFFAWAMCEGLLDSNPVVGTNRQPEKSRERVLADDELKIIWDALGPDDYSTVVRLLMLTGQRAARSPRCVGLKLSAIKSCCRRGGPRMAANTPSRWWLPRWPFSMTDRVTTNSCSGVAPAGRLAAGAHARPRLINVSARGAARLSIGRIMICGARRQLGWPKTWHSAAHHRSNLEPRWRSQGRNCRSLQSRGLRGAEADRARKVGRSC